MIVEKNTRIIYQKVAQIKGKIFVQLFCNFLLTKLRGSGTKQNTLGFELQTERQKDHLFFRWSVFNQVDRIASVVIFKANFLLWIDYGNL